MEREEQARTFLNFANTKYNDYLKKWRKHIMDRGMIWDEDVYSDTILKVYDNIIKKGITDTSETGMANYWFKSFIINIQREKQYSRNAYRDMNVDVLEELDKEFNGDEELQMKIRRNVYDDWVVYTILNEVEKIFDSTSFHCFRIYYLYPKMTYEKLREVTKIKDCKKRVVTIKSWLKENINKSMLDKEFNKYYDGD